MAEWFLYITGWIWAVIAPVSKHNPSANTLLLILKWVLHALLIFICIIVFQFLHNYSEFQRFVRFPGPGIRDHWLPLFFLILYVHIWMVWFLWFYSSFFLTSSPFPDIDSAWDNGLKTTKVQNVDISTTPIFLTIGHPTSGLNHLLKLHSQNTRNLIWQDSHCLPTVDGVYITYGNNCNLGSLESNLATDYLEQWKSFSEEQSSSDFNLMATTIEVETNPNHLNPETLNQKQSSLPIPASSPPKTQEMPQPDISATTLKPTPVSEINPESVSLATNLPKEEANLRAAYFTQKVVDLRFPLCPANGIAVVIPIPYLTQTNIKSILASAQKDLILIRDSLQLQCPVSIFFSDIDQIPGYSEFAPLLQTKSQKEPFGVAFSSCSNNLASSEVANKIKISLTWSLIEWLPKTIYPFLKNQNTTRKENSDIIKFLSLLWKIEPIMSQFTARLLTPDNHPPFLTGGCFFIATGNEPHQQGFYEPAFKNMIKLQNFVSWTSKAFYQDKIRGILTWLGYSLIMVWIGVTLYLLWWIVL